MGMMIGDTYGAYHVVTVSTSPTSRPNPMTQSDRSTAVVERALRGPHLTAVVDRPRPRRRGVDRAHEVVAAVVAGGRCVDARRDVDGRRKPGTRVETQA